MYKPFLVCKYKIFLYSVHPSFKLTKSELFSEKCGILLGLE